MRKINLSRLAGAHPVRRRAALTARLALAAPVLLALTACGEKPSPPTAAQLASFKPADARLATLYAGSCRACHTKPDSGAPLVHDHAAWDPRWAKSLPVLTDHAIVGFQAMPAGGQCTACTKQDYENLIRFMAGHEGER
jgi:cytochrome c5